MRNKDHPAAQIRLLLPGHLAVRFRKIQHAPPFFVRKAESLVDESAGMTLYRFLWLSARPLVPVTQVGLAQSVQEFSSKTCNFGRYAKQYGRGFSILTFISIRICSFETIRRTVDSDS